MLLVQRGVVADCPSCPIQFWSCCQARPRTLLTRCHGRMAALPSFGVLRPYGTDIRRRCCMPRFNRTGSRPQGQRRAQFTLTETTLSHASRRREQEQSKRSTIATVTSKVKTPRPCALRCSSLEGLPLNTNGKVGNVLMVDYVNPLELGRTSRAGQRDIA